MDFVFNRQSGVPVRDQLVAQLEMKILGGTFRPGMRLPSVRTLARRLRLHANTVSAAYRDLEASGRVHLQRGSGVFVRGDANTDLERARDLDEMIRLALAAALRKGFVAGEIRSAVKRWLVAGPPDRLVAVDRTREMAEVLAHELRDALGCEAVCASLAEVQADPRLLAGAIAVTPPYHLDELVELPAVTRVEGVTVEMSAENRKLVLDLPAGAIVLVVSHSAVVLRFAARLISSLRGDELLTHMSLRQDAEQWKRIVPAAHIVFADAPSCKEVAAESPRRLHEVRVITDECLARLRPLLAFAVRRKTRKRRPARA